MNGDFHAELVSILRKDLPRAMRLLNKHLTDSSGRCPTCKSGGASSGRVVGPCALYSAAAQALAKVNGA